MKKAYTLITAFLFIMLTIRSQNPSFAWAKSMGSTLNDIGYCCALDLSGNIYTTGNFLSTVDFDPNAGVFNLTSTGAEDVFIQKLDANGNFIWAKKIGSTGIDDCYSVHIDGSGNVYVTGYFAGITDFDPGVGTYTLSPVGNEDIFLLKLDANGNFLWARSMGGATFDSGASLTTDASGNLYVTGRFQATVDFDPGVGVYNLISNGSDDEFVLKLDGAGNFIWANSIGGTSADRGSSIVLDVSGNVCVAGYFRATVDFDPGVGTYTVTSAGVDDIFIQKLNSNGAFLWAKTMGGVNSDRAYSIATDGSGNLYTTGPFVGTVDFDPGPGTFTVASNALSMDVYIHKVDASGNFLWVKSFGGNSNDDGLFINVDVSGNVTSTGSYRNTVDFDPGPGAFNLTSLGSADIYVEKLDAGGNFIWAVSMGSTGADFGFSVVTNTLGSVYTTGYYFGSVDFDPTVGTYSLTSVGQTDAFVQKLLPCNIAPLQPGAINGSVTVCNGTNHTYSIATVVGAITYNWSLPGGWSGSSSTNTISATPGTTGIFTVTASNACGTSPQQTLNVTVNALPSITVNSGSICSGASFTINPNGASTYTFSSGPIVSPSTTSSYSVTGTSTAGCVSSSAAISNVTVNPLPTISANTSNTLICVGQSATLTASGASTYTWNPGGTGTSITVSPTVTSNYTITGVDANGCVNSLTFTQNVSACTGLSAVALAKEDLVVYPNPTNGEFIIKGISDVSIIHIYNALGEEVASTSFSFGEALRVRLEQPNGIYFIKIGNFNTKIIKQ